MKTKMEMKRPNVFRLRFKLQILNGIKKSLFLKHQSRYTDDYKMSFFRCNRIEIIDKRF